MNPVNVKEWTTAYGRGEIKDLSVLRGADGALWSIWKPGWLERLKLIVGVPIALGVMSDRQPPVALKVCRPKELGYQRDDR